jgi:UDP-N-acetyl-D-glucosamine dehydrogenase
VRRDAGRQFRVLEEAEDVNAQTPAWVASRIGEALNDHGRAVKGANVLVLGVAYKPDVGDIRESPSIKVMRQLHRRGARVRYHDPLVRSVEVGERSVGPIELTRDAVEHADCVALLTPHALYDLDWLADHAKLVFDARNAFGQARRPNVVRL